MHHIFHGKLCDSNHCSAKTKSGAGWILGFPRPQKTKSSVSRPQKRSACGLVSDVSVAGKGHNGPVFGHLLGAGGNCT